MSPPDGLNWKVHAHKLDALEAQAKKQRLGAWGGPTAEKKP
jgi:hypothetical protein